MTENVTPRSRGIRKALADAGEWAYGDFDDLDHVAAEGEYDGFSPARVRQWLASRTWDPGAAAAMSEDGLDPDWAAVISPEGEGRGAYVDTRGYKISNGDLRISEVADR